MRALLLMLAAAAALDAADEQKLALDASAQSAFQQVFTAAAPDMAAANRCVQAQAMLLSVSTPDETPSIAFRKAYCALAAALATDDRAGFSKAAEDFDDAIADATSPGRQRVAQAAPAVWRTLAAVARLNSGATGESQEKRLTAAVDADGGLNTADCQRDDVSRQFCRSVQQVGNAWLGKIALDGSDPFAAERRFANANALAWSEWIAGILAYRRGDYSSAASDYGRAIASWRGERPAALVDRLDPRPAMSGMLADWAGAQLASGDLNAAAANLDTALKQDPANARAFFLRAIAEERLGRDAAATEDYDRASRAALAKTGEEASAEAHFYRGIVFYRRKEFVRAENEFDSALSANIAVPWKADAQAWRHLAAVSAGACGASRDYLDRALGSVSPYFPKPEASAAARACTAATELQPR
jgi:tetratricopeptide (TPR) repeat protein